MDISTIITHDKRVDRALKGDRLMKATTGLSVSEFNGITLKFGQEIEVEKWNRG
ncbi:MAG: hypothetical protein ACXQTO_06340 [Candidatus Syntropharchaeales archaeon]